MTLFELIVFSLSVQLLHQYCFSSSIENENDVMVRLIKSSTVTQTEFYGTKGKRYFPQVCLGEFLLQHHLLKGWISSEQMEVGMVQNEMVITVSCGIILLTNEK